MRNISPTSILTLQKSAGIEPVILIRIHWATGTSVTYSDRRFSQYGYQGKLLQITGMEDVLDINNSASSASVDIILDDTDGQLKNVFNNNDIHKTRVQVLQWFTELPVDEAFVIFEGEISSPIVWKDSDRTLSFIVLTKLEDREVGFSVEEGTMTNVPQSFFGKAWPMVFGTVGGIPALQINEAPVLVLQEGIGIVDVDVWNAELAKLQANILEVYDQWLLAFTTGLREAYIAARFKSDFPQFGLVDDPERAEQHDQAAQGYFQQAAQYWQDHLALNAELNTQKALFELQKSIDANTKHAFKAFGKNLPGITLTFQISGWVFTGKYNGNQVTEVSRTKVEDPNRNIAYNSFNQTATLTSYKSEIRGNKFEWIDAGTQVTFLQYPLYYIVGIGALTIRRVYSYKKGVPVTLAPSSYNVSQLTVGSLVYTKLLIDPPLSQRKTADGISEGWDNDSIYADTNNTVGPNVVDIFKWVIETFTPYSWDTTTFAYVRTLVDKYPANFALLERKNVIDFLKDVAFQARCSIWLNDNVFYVRYLPEALVEVETITLQDIVVNTLQVTTTDTERLITKFVALWRYSLDQEEPSKIIYKYNIQKYGTFEEEYNFYIYNQEELVKKSAEFWIIRKANTYKIMQFKTALHKLKLEALDPVLINLPSDIVCDEPVVGIVQRAIYDSETNLIDMEVWVPVRFGEMTRYAFAYPKDLDATYIYPVLADPLVESNNPFESANGQLIESQYVPYEIPFVITSKGKPWNWGRDQAIGDTFDVANPSLPANLIALHPQELLPGVPVGLRNFNNVNNYQVKPVKAISVEAIPPASFPGFVLNKTGTNQYNVSAFLRGTINPPVTVSVYQFYQHVDEVIPPGTPTIVHRLIYRLADGSQSTEFFMQVPIWVPPQGV